MILKKGFAQLVSIIVNVDEVQRKPFMGKRLRNWYQPLPSLAGGPVQVAYFHNFHLCEIEGSA